MAHRIVSMTDSGGSITMPCLKMVQSKEKDALLYTIPKDSWLKYGYMSGDTFIIGVESNHLKLTPAVRISRLQREWNKYIRRMKKYDICFDIYRSNKCIGKLVPHDV
ncbi:MAG: hypothetical protein QM500_09180 [Methylococcales bacterium]